MQKESFTIRLYKCLKKLPYGTFTWHNSLEHCKFISDVAVVLLQSTLKQIGFYSLGVTKAQSASFNGALMVLATASLKKVVGLQFRHNYLFFECTIF